MISEKFTLRPRHILVLVLSGTLIRFFFGIYSKAWMASPDQLAWGLSLDEMIRNGSWTYNQLIHYPHEGGSLMASLFAIVLHPFNTLLPALSLSALLIDTFSRWIQIKMAQHVYGNTTATWFGVWTVLGVPLLLPWATVNFGMHALAAFFPFLFLYFVTTDKSRMPDGIWCGLVTGLAISFSYDSILLIPAFVFWKLFAAETVMEKIKATGRFVGISFLILLPHIFFRLLADNGFHLGEFSSTSIRGVNWTEVSLMQTIDNFRAVLEKHICGAFFLSPESWITFTYQQFILLAFFLAALILPLLQKKSYPAKATPLILMLVVLHALAYAGSPFYSSFTPNNSYVYFRYFAYILPLLSVFIINGLVHSGKWRFLAAGSWLVLCGYFSISYMQAADPQKSIAYKAAGWVLAAKYGDQPHKLLKLRDAAPESQKEELMIGFGWGLTTALLEHETNPDGNSVKQLRKLISQFSVSDQQLIRKGIDQAFSPGVTPVLDSTLHTTIFSQEFQ